MFNLISCGTTSQSSYDALTVLLIVCIIAWAVSIPFIMYKCKKEEGESDKEALKYVFWGDALKYFRIIKEKIDRKRRANG